MKRKIPPILPLLLAMCLFTGCYGPRETEEEAFIVALGIDTAENNLLKFTFVVAVPRTGGSGPAGGGGQEEQAIPAMRYSTVAPSSAEARNLLASAMSRYANISHLRAIVISEDVARKGISDVLAPVVRYREFRGGSFVLISEGTAEQFLNKNKPVLDINFAKYFESMILSGRENAYYIRSDAHEVYLGLKNPGHSAYATYVAINPKTGDNIPIRTKMPEAKAESYKAGDIPRTGTVNPAEFAGIAVFSGDKMTGILDGRSTRILYILQNKLKDDRLVLADPLKPEKSIQLIARSRNKPDIKVRLIDGREFITIKVDLETEIISNPSGINYEKGEYRELLQQQISNLTTEEINRFVQLTQSMGSDVYGFGRHLRGQFKTYNEIANLNFEELYKNANVDLTVSTTIRRSGLIWRTSPVKPGTTS